MTAANHGNGEGDKLVQSVRLHERRQHRLLRDGPPSVAHRLAQIGVLGWMIVLPMLLGTFAGRWLDRSFATGVFFTAPLLLLGLALGCWSAWKWMHTA